MHLLLKFQNDLHMGTGNNISHCLNHIQNLLFLLRRDKPTFTKSPIYLIPIQVANLFRPSVEITRAN